MRVLVAMSGGVDSSVAAALLVRDGHEVVGCTLRLWGGESDSGCCSAADVDDARRVAQVLGIDHHVFNLAEEFQTRVVDPYVAAHDRGETPNPCVECNRSIKFDVLYARAQRLGFDAIATGHHARVERGPDGVELRRGRDAAKDQSYVLGFLDASVLDRVMLPVGSMTKAQVRDLAISLGLRTALKKDSQEVCFIPRKGRARFLADRATLTPGVVVDQSTGERLGSVDAVQLVTVGQRRGIGVGSDGAPRFVSQVDVASGTVLVGRRHEVEVRAVALDACSVRWHDRAAPRPRRVVVQLSAHGTPCAATVRDDDSALDLEASVRPVAAGQLAVLYDVLDPDLVIGSATVARPVPAFA